MASRTECYVDTSALIAFLDRSDGHHQVFLRLFSDPPPLLTSPLVIAEGHAWFLKRYDPGRAIQFLAFIDDLTPLRIIETGAEELRRSSALVRKFKDQPLTIADALGLFIMKRFRVQCCWSTDKHLGLTGVPLVIHRS